ncbi:PfkB family carbohydrate kinase [Okeania sp. SIO3B5]|uniref:PfkB family carbohydrate kinase n=1 Tax=Okeania sp. SIO3B5 TaxID=2607811 RepID=UPI0035C922FD
MWFKASPFKGIIKKNFHLFVNPLLSRRGNYSLFIIHYSLLNAGGGKGANQAVAAARLGISTKIVGRVGNDSFGQQLLTSLQTANVDTTGVVVDENIHTGVAVIAVDARGENSIIVVPGANHSINNTDVERLINLLSDATALLLQLEIPLEFAMSAAKVAQKMGVKVILVPAPMPVSFPDDFYGLIDIIISCPDN